MQYHLAEVDVIRDEPHRCNECSDRNDCPDVWSDVAYVACAAPDVIRNGFPAYPTPQEQVEIIARLRPGDGRDARQLLNMAEEAAAENDIDWLAACLRGIRYRYHCVRLDVLGYTYDAGALRRTISREG
jgi:hypothetical protein